MGDIVDCRDETMGAWFEAKLVKITKSTSEPSKPEVGDAEKSSGDVMEIDQNENSLVKDDSKVDTDAKDTEKDSDNKFTEVKEKTELAKDAKLCPFYKCDEDGFVYHVVFDG